MESDELQGCGIVEMAWQTCWKTCIYILGRLAWKTCSEDMLGRLAGSELPGVYIYIYILRRLVWKACLEVLLG
jgi:hypothetical protein